MVADKAKLAKPGHHKIEPANIKIAGRRTTAIFHEQGSIVVIGHRQAFLGDGHEFQASAFQGHVRAFRPGQGEQ
jgi:hypothetical protein